MTIWFSASRSLMILPNSVGLPALPLPMTSVDGSKRLTILPSAWVSPAKMRAVVWRITRCTRGTIFSSFWRRPSSTAWRRMLADDLLFGARGKLDAGADLFGEALRLAHNPAGRIQQVAVGLFEPCLTG